MEAASSSPGSDKRQKGSKTGTGEGEKGKGFERVPQPESSKREGELLPSFLPQRREERRKALFGGFPFFLLPCSSLLLPLPAGQPSPLGLTGSFVVVASSPALTLIFLVSLSFPVCGDDLLKVVVSERG